jgi:bifunctional isochorismate lyase/aryl carrier protein
MTIPSIAPYVPPGAHELPLSRVSWQPDLTRALLLIHDMQRYFLRFYPTDQSPVRELLSNVRALRAFAHAADVPVVFSAQPADPARARRGLLSDVWGPGLTAHAEEQEIARELTPQPGERLLEKTRYSAFHGTELLSLLREQRRDQLWICGVFAHIGCMLTAFDAFMHDVKPFLVADAVADFSREHHELSLSLVASRCGVTLTTASLCSLPLGRTVAGPDRLRELLEAEIVALAPEAAGRLQDAAELAELGLDSVRRMELIERLMLRGIEVPAVDLMECSAFGALLELVRSAGSEREPAERAS